MIVSIKTPHGVQVRASGDVDEFIKLLAFGCFIDWLFSPQKRRRRINR